MKTNRKHGRMTALPAIALAIPLLFALALLFAACDADSLIKDAIQELEAKIITSFRGLANGKNLEINVTHTGTDIVKGDGYTVYLDGKLADKGTVSSASSGNISFVSSGAGSPTFTLERGSDDQHPTVSDITITQNPGEFGGQTKIIGIEITSVTDSKDTGANGGDTDTWSQITSASQLVGTWVNIWEGYVLDSNDQDVLITSTETVIYTGTGNVTLTTVDSNRPSSPSTRNDPVSYYLNSPNWEINAAGTKIRWDYYLNGDYVVYDKQ